MSMRQRRRASSKKGEDRIQLSISSSTTSNSSSENVKVGVKPKQYSAPPSAPQTSTENPSKVDVFLSNYCEHTSCTYFVDIGIKILVYTLWAISYITRTSHDPLVENNVFSSSLRYLSIEIQMARYVLRFFGSLEALEGFRSGSWAGGTWDNPRIAMIAKYFLAGSMLIFYPLDHIAYFGWMVPDLVKVDAERYYSYSCWCWLVYLVADIFVSRLKSAELKKKIMDLEKLLLGRKKKNDDDDERNEEAMDVFKEKQILLHKKLSTVRLQALCSTLALLPALNWSIPNWDSDPHFNEYVVNGLMLIESYVCLYIAANYAGNEDKD